MDKIKIHQFDPVIYPIKIWVVYNPTMKFIAKEFERIDGVNIDEDESTEMMAASVYSKVLRRKRNKMYGFLISIYEKLEVGHIAHESCHAVGFIYNHLGVQFSTIEDEPHAYLTGWVASCIDKVNKLID